MGYPGGRVNLFKREGTLARETSFYRIDSLSRLPRTTFEDHRCVLELEQGTSPRYVCYNFIKSKDKLEE